VWGGGSTVTERELALTGRNTIYSMWDGYGIIGPHQGERLPTFAGLWGRITLKQFLDRYKKLDGKCSLMTGELKGVGCDEYCPVIEAKCDDGPLAGGRCMEACAELPRSTLDCLATREGACDPTECLFVERLPASAGGD
jgi:hypothetical protein